ncbi:hypothetical protein SLA2020_123680 [Shorea laevis]
MFYLRFSPQPAEENHANPQTCFFHVLFKGGALAFYMLSALFVDSFVTIFVITVVVLFLPGSFFVWLRKSVV